MQNHANICLATFLKLSLRSQFDTEGISNLIEDVFFEKDILYNKNMFLIFSNVSMQLILGPTKNL